MITMMRTTTTSTALLLITAVSQFSCNREPANMFSSSSSGTYVDLGLEESKTATDPSSSFEMLTDDLIDQVEDPATREALQDVRRGSVEVNALLIDFKEGERDLSQSIVHMLAREGNSQLLGTLAQAGADMNVEDNMGRTPAHVAAEHDQAGAISVLLETGANMNQAAHDGNTPAMIAHQRGHASVSTALSEANVHLPLAELLTDELIDKVANPAAQAALRAVRAGQTDVNALLMEHEDNASVSSSHSIAHVLASEGNDQVLGILAQGGAEMNVRDSNCRTPAHEAAAHGRVVALRNLHEASADMNARDNHNCTPAHAAAENGHV